MTEKIAQCTTFYNGACPLCSMEIGRYRADANAVKASLSWVDVSTDGNGDALAHYGVTQDMAYRRLYALDANGKLVVGVDAFILIWQALPRWRWLARVMALPVVHPVACWMYEHVAARAIYAWNKRRLRKAAQAAE